MIPETHVSPEELAIRQIMELRVAIWLKEKLHPTPRLLNDHRRGRPRGMTAETVNKVIALLETTTLTHQAIGDQVGISQTMVSSIGIVMRAIHEPARVG